uniref:DNA-directed RNA polymerase III subunit n=1 Tax=Scophthalmus maximus TaxID=52904 RepID=A0A8D3BM41_SCOMX
MAGRGGRTMSFSMDAVGINRGDSLPPSMQQPTPAFPAMEQKPLPLAGGEEAEYLLALKQEFRGAMRSRPCFIQPAAARRDVERYSDKYHSSEQTDTQLDWTPESRGHEREHTLEKKEQQSSEEEEEEKKKQEEEEAEVEEEYEEEFEEETDYIMSYFDNGEDFGGDSDDPMDEAIY